MRLTELRIAGFRSVADEITLRIRPELTCLIGANEHGKSNLLDALNLMDGGTFDEFAKNTGSRKKDQPNLRFVLQLSDKERKDIAATLKAYLEEPEPEDDAGKRSRAFVQSSYKYFDLGKSRLDLILDPENARRIILPGLVSYAVPSFDATKPQAHLVAKWVLDHLPQVRLFQPTSELADSITLQDLNGRKNLPFEGLLKLADGWDDRALLFEDSTRARQRLDQLGRALTRKIQRIWSQGSGHTYRFDNTGGRLHISIKDPVAFDVPSRRSLGFRSFLSFYLTLLAETDEVDPDGYLLLFDEPGIHLHPQGQKDLLAELRRLASNNQIVYATHSPFMIDRNEPASTVLIYKGSKGKEKGTRVNYKPWGANWHLLNGALGVTPADAFFLPERPVVVEGTSDKLYVATYMSLTRKHTGADLNFLTIIDGDRSGDVEAIVRILTGAGRDVTVVIDNDEGGRDWAKALSKLAGSKRGTVVVLNLGKVCDTAKPVSIEDLLPESDWQIAVQKYVTDLIGSDHAIEWTELTELAKSRTMGRAVADYLVAAGVLESVKKFSKTNVAHLLCQQTLPVPDSTSPMTRLCMEITRRIMI